MQKIILGVLACLVLSSCGDQEGPSYPPPSDEALAAQKFQNSKAIKSLKEKGVKIRCDDSCVDVTDSFLQLLEKNIDALVKLSRKVEEFEVESKPNHNFSSPSGTNEFTCAT